ncbi:unnamed protein product [Ectocarpus sp. 12 AP-2014]
MSTLGDNASEGGHAGDHPPAGEQPENFNSADGGVISVNGAAGDNPNAGGNAAGANAGGVINQAAMDVDEEEEEHHSDARSSVPPIQITPLLSGPSNMDSTIRLLQAHVNKKCARLEAGEIEQLSDQTMTLMDKLYNAVSLRAASGSAAPNSGGSSSEGSGSGGSSKGGPVKGQRTGKGKGRPKCTHSTCEKKLGHTLETCYTRLREEREARKARDKGKAREAAKRNGNGNGNGGGKRSKKASDEDDEH